MYTNPVTGEEQDTNPDTGLTDYELEQRYDQMLDECYPEVQIGWGTYSASTILKECDPIAYRVGLSDYESDLETM